MQKCSDCSADTLLHLFSRCVYHDGKSHREKLILHFFKKFSKCSFMARFRTEIKLFLKCRQMFLQETSKVFDYIIVIFIVAYFLKCSLSLAYNAYLLVMFQVEAVLAST